MSPEMFELIMAQKRPYEGIQLVSIVAEGGVHCLVDILRIFVTPCLAFHTTLFGPSALCDWGGIKIYPLNTS
jgi:hypothetical protein